MPPFRNPFVKKPPVTNSATFVGDENTRPAAANGFEKNLSRPDYAGSRASSALSIKAGKQEPREFKLSGRLGHLFSQPLVFAADAGAVVNDSGVYLPVQFPQCFALWGALREALMRIQ